MEAVEAPEEVKAERFEMQIFIVLGMFEKAYGASKHLDVFPVNVAGRVSGR